MRRREGEGSMSTATTKGGRNRRRRRRNAATAFLDKAAALEHARSKRRWIRAAQRDPDDPDPPPGVDQYGFPVPNSHEADLEVTPGYWRPGFTNPKNVVTDEWRIGVRPTLVARAGRSGDATVLAAAPRMLEALLACEVELSEQLRDERQLMRRCEDSAARPPRGFLAGGRRYVQRMRDSAALAWTRIRSLEAALGNVREAISCARPELADERGWHWPDFGVESGEEREDRRRSGRRHRRAA